ncbi:MAG: Coenzyme F420 hydrogenase/dehydrogenase, beta subunit C-terminal domain [Candidatus Hermodarchaeota archaeon]
MNTEVSLTWEYLKNIADTLDSYRVRALIDAKDDILNAGVYNEDQYYTLIFRMFDEDLLKYSLFEFLKSKSKANIDILKEFSQQNSLDLKKIYSLLLLLKSENLIKVEELFDEIEGEDEENPPKLVFRDLKIDSFRGEISQIRSIYEPVEVIFKEKVCSGCGTCAGICPVNCLDVLNGFGQIDTEKCIRCGLCYHVCPRSYFPVRIINMYQSDSSLIEEYSNIGHFIEVYSARSKVKEISDVCQDGGISSTCLHYLFDNNLIDYALGAKMSNTLWRPEPLILKSKEDIIQTTGTKYVNNPTLRNLNEFNKSNHNVAVVGVPCMMQALKKSEIYNIGIPSLNNIKYKIGIFCMESFSYQSLLQICEVLKVDVKDVKKMDINKGKFFVYTNNGEELAVPIKEITHLAREDCELCFDLTSESADLSVGSIGSPAGWNTVIIRTELGKNLYNSLVENNLIESKPISEVKPGLPLLQKIAGSKKTKCNKHIDAKLKEDKRVPYY